MNKITILGVVAQKSNLYRLSDIDGEMTFCDFFTLSLRSKALRAQLATGCPFKTESTVDALPRAQLSDVIPCLAADAEARAMDRIAEGHLVAICGHIVTDRRAENILNPWFWFVHVQSVHDLGPFMDADALPVFSQNLCDLYFKEPLGPQQAPTFPDDDEIPFD